MEENESRPPLFGLIVLFVGAALITVGVGFLTYGLYTLMRTGIWPSYPASKMISEIGIPLQRLHGAARHRRCDRRLRRLADRAAQPAPAARR
jgi:hypothetical protein